MRLLGPPRVMIRLQLSPSVLINQLSDTPRMFVISASISERVDRSDVCHTSHVYTSANNSKLVGQSQYCHSSHVELSASLSKGVDKSGAGHSSYVDPLACITQRFDRSRAYHSSHAEPYERISNIVNKSVTPRMRIRLLQVFPEVLIGQMLITRMCICLQYAQPYRQSHPNPTPLLRRPPID